MTGLWRGGKNEKKIKKKCVGPSGLCERRRVCVCGRATVWQTTDQWRRRRRRRRSIRAYQTNVCEFHLQLRRWKVLNWKHTNVCVLMWAALRPQADLPQACCANGRRAFQLLLRVFHQSKESCLPSKLTINHLWYKADGFSLTPPPH